MTAVLYFSILLVIFQGSFGVEIFTNQPLSTKKPHWPSKTHSKHRGDFIDDSLKSKPLPTNAWWMNLVLNDGHKEVAVLPYELSAHASTGLHICLPEKEVHHKYIYTKFVDDIVIGSRYGLGPRKVVAFDELSVTLDYKDSQSSMKFPIVRGMPYVTALLDYVAPTLTSKHGITKINGQSAQSGAKFDGQKFTISLSNGQTWSVYTDSSITLVFDGNGIYSEHHFTGSFRVAASTDSAQAAVLDKHAEKIPIGGHVSAKSSGDKSSLQFNFKTQGSGDLLMMSMKHHRQTLDQSVLRRDLTVGTLKGTMVGAVGEVWNMSEDLTTISWSAPRPVKEDKLSKVKEALKGDINKGVTQHNTYFGGKEMAAIARLALIADELGESGLRDTYISHLKGYLDEWLASSGDLVYDQTWGGVVDPKGIYDPGANFGMGYYNDHHFHFGYFVYAAAVIAKIDSSWPSRHGEEVIALIRDFANPALESGDPHFTFMRNKDWFVGHSWASGLFDSVEGRNQESTSESVNAWYGVYLYGLAIGDDRIKDLGRLALATEIRATQTYWQIDSGKDVYPAPFSDNKVVGINWSQKVDYNTWFGSDVEFIHCIQYLPFTPISEELLDKKWVTEEYPVLAQAIGSSNDGWKGYIYMGHGVINPDKAWEEVKSLHSYDDGNTKTNTLYWLATRP